MNQKQAKNWGFEIGNLKFRKAFTLIELLVAISILALLVAAASIYWKNAVVKRRDTQRKADLKTLQLALEAYLHQNGHYPPIPTNSKNWCSTQDGWTNKNYIPHGLAYYLVSDYLEKLPLDPINVDYGASSADTYQYCYSYDPADSAVYSLTANLENRKDPEAITFWQTTMHLWFNYSLSSP